MSKTILAPDMPCGHPGCLSRVTHPCEGCGRVAGVFRYPFTIYFASMDRKTCSKMTIDRFYPNLVKYHREDLGMEPVRKLVYEHVEANLA